MNYFKYKGHVRNQNPLPWITLTEIELKKILESDGNLTFKGLVVDENAGEEPIERNIVVYQQALMPDAEAIYIPHRIFKETSLVALQRRAHAGKEYGICLEDADPNKEEVYRHLMPTDVNHNWAKCFYTKVKQKAAL